MQFSSSFYQQLNNETDNYSTQEPVPPPYHDQDQNEILPQYIDASMELDGILDRFAPRWDNQRIQHDYYNSNEKSAVRSTSSSFEKTNTVLDRMEDYRHNDQEWTSQSEMKRKQMMTNMYHIRHTPTSSCCTATTTTTTKSLSSSAKSKYYKITLSIAKEREHIIHRMKKMRSPSKSASSSHCKNEFDQFLHSIHHTSSQFEMTNQRATLIIPTI